MMKRAKKPTKSEAERMDRVKNGPCLACQIWGKSTKMTVEVHHQTKHGRTLGHAFTVGLCHFHHQAKLLPRGFDSRKAAAAEFGPSYADGREPWEKEFGTDEELLTMQNLLLERLK